MSHYPLLSELIESLPLPCFIKDRTGKYVACNHCFCAFLGKEKEDILNSNVYNIALSPLDEIYFKKDEELFQAGGVQIYTSQVDSVLGRVDVCFIKRLLIFDIADVLILGFVWNEDFLKKYLPSIASSKSVLENFEEIFSAGEMISEIVHDINNPLMVILGKIHIMRQFLNAEEYDKVLFEKYLDDTEKSILSVSQFLQTLNLHKKNVDLSAMGNMKLMIENLKALFYFEFRKFKISFIVENNNIDLENTFVKTIFFRVFINILKNAIDSISEDTNASVDKYIKIDLKLEEGFLLADIENNGPFISPENQSRLFEPYFSTKKAEKGTGLGLSICKHICETQSGALVLLSSIEEKTIFRVKICL